MQLLTCPPTTPVAFGTPVPRVDISLGNAFQALDPAKNTVVNISLTSQASISLLNATQASQKAEIWMGSTNNPLGDGFLIGKHENTQSGTLVVTLVLNQSITTPHAFLLPKHWWYLIRQTLGANLVINSVNEQAVS